MLLSKKTSKIVNHIDIGYWELRGSEILWSLGFISDLGFKEKDLKIELDYFLNNLIHRDDSKQFRNNFFSFTKNNTHFRQSMLIKSKKGKYKEFVCNTNLNLSNDLSKESKLIFFSKRKFKTNKKVKKDKFYYKETAEMTQTGSWYIDFTKKRSYWDQQSRRILEHPEDYLPSLKNSKKYFAKESLYLAKKVFFECALKGISFNKELKMVTKNHRELWVKAIGKPVFDETKNIIGVRGVFQDIDKKKAKELDVLRTSNIIASQNKRLFNFAHIVSHNLRSHTSNLTLIGDLINSTNDTTEKLELLSNVELIAKSLNETIEQLNEVVTIQTSTNKSKTQVYFKDIFKQVSTSISQIIVSQKTEIHTDFSNLEKIEYIPAYLESIMLNLITNAIKYKHQDRKPIINIKSYIENSNKILEVSDNGLGIDLKTFGDKIFGMYKTFHYNKDARGIGLFITKNQIEALHGEISVESEINIGTTFKIKF